MADTDRWERMGYVLFADTKVSRRTAVLAGFIAEQMGAGTRDHISTPTRIELMRAARKVQALRHIRASAVSRVLQRLKACGYVTFMRCPDWWAPTDRLFNACSCGLLDGP